MTIFEHILNEINDGMWFGDVVGNTKVLEEKFEKVLVCISNSDRYIGQTYYIYILENGNKQYYIPYAHGGPFLPFPDKPHSTQKIELENDIPFTESYQTTDKDYFDAMTDGTMGDWEDFEGNSDYLDDWAGR